MLINIITRCSRPNNLDKLKESIKLNKIKSVKWWILFDCNSINNIDINLLSNLFSFKDFKINIKFLYSDKISCGYDMVNSVLNEIENSEWIYLLDDDNLLHHNFWKNIKKCNVIDKNIIVFSQYVGGKDFTNLKIREAKPTNMKYQGVDCAQFIFKRSIITDFKLNYAADGYFIEEKFKNNPSDFLFINKILSYYNCISNKNIESSPKVLLIGKDGDIKTTHTEGKSNHLNKIFIKNDLDIDKVLSEYDPDSIVTIGKNWSDFNNLSHKHQDIRKRWIHQNNLNESIGDLSYRCAMNYILNPFYEENCLVSIFTPLFNTGNRLNRTYESVKNQSYKNWEWVLVNDSDDSKTLKIAYEISKNDSRVKVYDFNNKSNGIIGESKYRSASLCNGKYLIELDHDDYLTVDAIYWMVKAFKKYPDCKFVYSDTSEIYENNTPFVYGDSFAFGYGTYRDESYNGKIYKTMNTPNINPKTIRHIVGVPNHFRAWDRIFYHSIGGHNRRLSIADDYELIIRTFLNTKMVRIPKMLYIQYHHFNNTQNKTRLDIQRRVDTISKYYSDSIKKRFEDLGKVDWAYGYSNINSIDSKFGNDENYVNYIFKQDLYTYNNKNDLTNLNYLF